MWNGLVSRVIYAKTALLDERDVIVDGSNCCSALLVQLNDRAGMVTFERARSFKVFCGVNGGLGFPIRNAPRDQPCHRTNQAKIRPEYCQDSVPNWF